MAKPAPVQNYASRLIRSLETIVDLDDDCKARLNALPMRIVKVDEGVDLIRTGDHPTESILVLQGLVCRYKIVAAGQRQILSLHLPGDMPDLHGLHLTHMDHSIGTMVPSTVAYIPHPALQQMIDESAPLANVLWRATLVDASIFREWMANIGTRSAIQRVSHLFCEIYVRMRTLGLADAKGFRLPLTQAAMGDALGVSTVHVNRTLQQMRRDGLIESHGKFHGISDWEGLKRTGDFDPYYLHLKRDYVP
jgi:CRP-like cAMP-binding protein